MELEAAHPVLIVVSHPNDPFAHLYPLSYGGIPHVSSLVSFQWTALLNSGHRNDPTLERSYNNEQDL